MKKLIVFGLGSISELAQFYFDHDSEYRVEAFTVDGAFMKESSVGGLPVIAWEEIEKRFSIHDYHLFVAIGYSQMNRLRTVKVREAEEKGYAVAHYVSSKATVFSDFQAKPNQFILEDNTIQPFTRIGKNVILWCGNHIGHHSVVEENCFLSKTIISGHLIVGAGSFLGVNTTVRDGVRIGRENLIGAGSLILKDTGDGEVYAVKGTEKSRVPSSRITKF